MDYQSFQPGGQDQNYAPTPSPVQLMPHKNFTPKFVWAIVGLLVLAGVASAGLWFWNDKNKEAVVPTFTPRVVDETAGWQTYRNDEYGFEVKYPMDHIIRQLPTPEVFLMQIESPTLKPVFETFDKADFVISISKEKPADFKDFQVIPEQEITIDNIKTVERLVTYPAGYGKRYSALVRKEEFYYEILSYEVDLFPLAKERFDQILSTLKFIEPVLCIQVITPARNPQTGEEKDFPTPCDVPEGWVKI